MKRKHMVRAAAVVLACAALTGAALALSTGDSLISLSYLNDTYIPTVVAQGTKAADEKLIQAYQAASQKLDEVNQGYGVQQGSGGSYSADLRSRDMVRGDQLKLPTGSVVQLAAGAGTVVHTGAVIDVTAGQTVASGAALVSGHRYLVGEDTSAVFTADSGLAKVGVQGSFEKTESGEKAAPFTDVSRSDWYSSAVDYVYFEQLFSGTGDGLFSPMASMDRAMIVTVFYNRRFLRCAGRPVVRPLCELGGGPGGDGGDGGGYLLPGAGSDPPGGGGPALQLRDQLPGSGADRAGRPDPL